MFGEFLIILCLCTSSMSLTAGKDACLQIYSVPKQNVVCDPSQQVLDQIDDIRASMDSQTQSLIAINARIDNFDPDKPKELPENVQNKLSLIDEILDVQELHNVSLKLSQENLVGVTDDILVLRGQLKEETEAKVQMQEQLQNLEIQYSLVTQQSVSCMTSMETLENKLNSVTDEVNRWQHLTPRALKVHDCLEALRFYHPVSGVYSINPSPALQPYDVYCQMADGDSGWTIIQRRMDGTVDFFRGWNDYREGFGDAAGEYWLGLQRIHVLTNTKPYQLRIDLQDWTGRWWYAKYDTFSVGDEESSYELHVTGYQGNMGDSLSYHDGTPFTTMDRNNDKKDGMCATWCHGAWWYKDCFLSNLNGRYYQKGPYIPDTNWGDGVNWKTTFNTYYYSFKTSEIKIKPVDE